MSGETFLCEVCGLLIDWEHDWKRDQIRWFRSVPWIGSMTKREYSTTTPSPHNHVPRLEKVVK